MPKTPKQSARRKYKRSQRVSVLSDGSQGRVMKHHGATPEDGEPLYEVHISDARAGIFRESELAKAKEDA